MKPRLLNFHFQCGYLPQDLGRDARKRIFMGVAGFSPLSLWIEKILREQDVFCDPPVPWVNVVLDADPAPVTKLGNSAPKGKGPTLEVELNFNPMVLGELPLQDESLGELAITLVGRALDRLEAEAGLDATVIRPALNLFRDGGYVFRTVIKDAKAPGRLGRWSIVADLRPSSTTCSIVITRNDDVLLEKVFCEMEGASLVVARGFTRIDRDGAILSFPNKYRFGHPVPQIDISELLQ